MAAIALPPLALSSAQASTAPLRVSAGDLVSQMADGTEAIRILDASPLRTYRSGHISGATHVFWQDTIDANYPVFGAVVTQGFDQEQRLEVIRRFGVTPGDHIVAYDDESGFRAARIVWFLRLLGFSNTSLLDGGLPSWEAAGGSTESGKANPPLVDAVVDPQDGYYVVTEALRDRIARGDTDLLDIRSQDEIADTLNGALPIGTIPTSQPWPWDALVDADSGTLLPAESLLHQISDLGLTIDRDIVVFGRFGVETALSWLALRSIGFERVLTYDRGWVEWASTPGLAIAPVP